MKMQASKRNCLHCRDIKGGCSCSKKRKRQALKDTLTRYSKGNPLLEND